MSGLVMVLGLFAVTILAVVVGERTVGEVTSGLPSPTLGRPVAMALVATDALEEIAAGTVGVVDVRGRAVDVEQTPLPFYKRG